MEQPDSNRRLRRHLPNDLPTRLLNRGAVLKVFSEGTEKDHVKYCDGTQMNTYTIDRAVVIETTFRGLDLFRMWELIQFDPVKQASPYLQILDG
jgi:hypothetical protein